MRKQLIALMIGTLSFSCEASRASDGATSFADIYASLCMKHLMNLDGLRAKLKQVPKLPPEKAKNFLQGRPGDAWSVPDKHGTFVLALPHQTNQCTVYAHRADAKAVENSFVRLVATAPSPLTVKQTIKDQSTNAASGRTHTIGYEWSVLEARRKMQFLLTTADSDSAQVQAMATATVIDSRK